MIRGGEEKLRILSLLSMMACRKKLVAQRHDVNQSGPGIFQDCRIVRGRTFTDSVYINSDNPAFAISSPMEVIWMVPATFFVSSNHTSCGTEGSFYVVWIGDDFKIVSTCEMAHDEALTCLSSFVIRFTQLRDAEAFIHSFQSQALFVANFVESSDSVAVWLSKTRIVIAFRPIPESTYDHCHFDEVANNIPLEQVEQELTNFLSPENCPVM